MFKKLEILKVIEIILHRKAFSYFRNCNHLLPASFNNLFNSGTQVSCHHTRSALYLRPHCFLGRINQAPLGARAPGPPTLSPPPHSPKKRSCFVNDESKFGRITNSIIASESKFFFTLLPCRNRSATYAGHPEWWDINRYVQRLTSWQPTWCYVFVAYANVERS